MFRFEYVLQIKGISGLQICILKGVTILIISYPKKYKFINKILKLTLDEIIMKVRALRPPAPKLAIGITRFGFSVASWCNWSWSSKSSKYLSSRFSKIPKSSDSDQAKNALSSVKLTWMPPVSGTITSLVLWEYLLSNN